MEQRIKERFSDDILQATMRQYAIAPGQIKLLDGFESFMYEFTRPDGDYILRIGHSLRRSEALIQGEVHWINYLAAGGAGVARAILSEDGRLVVPVADGHGGHFLATAFVKAPGGSAWEMGQWHEPLFERYGRLLGRMHRLSRAYVPSPAGTRPHWDDPIMLFAMNWLPPEDGFIETQYRQLLANLRRLPRSRETYGLIHQDAHGGNFFVDVAGQITLFDFDDCVYSWYANDVAIVLFYAVTNRPDADTFGQNFMRHFLRGYRQESELSAEWLAQFPHFLKLREMDLYAVIHRSFDVDNLTDDWVRQFMAGRRERLQQGVPYVALDWAALA